RCQKHAASRTTNARNSWCTPTNCATNLRCMRKPLRSPEMTSHNDLYIGLMSGTSLDGVDAVLVRVEPALEIIATHFAAFPPALREQLLQLCAAGENEIERMGNADRLLGECYAQACES